VCITLEGSDWAIEQAKSSKGSVKGELPKCARNRPETSAVRVHTTSFANTSPGLSLTPIDGPKEVSYDAAKDGSVSPHSGALPTGS
jgi:hypothetical protein